METGSIADAAVAILDGSENVGSLIHDSLLGNGGILGMIVGNTIRFWLSLILFFFWVLALIWTIKDANARSSSFGFGFFAALCVILLTPLFGIPLYLAIRPQGWKWDKVIWRDVLFQQIHMCENCGSMNKIDHVCCTSCGESLQDTCRECQKKYSKSYSYCPNCGAPHLDV